MSMFLLFAWALAGAEPAWSEASFGERMLRVDRRVERLPSAHLGPFATRGDGRVLAIDDDSALVADEAGRTWERRPLFADGQKFLCRPERALLRTRDGALILAFLNQRELAVRWDQKQGGPLPGCRLPVYVTRSVDDGQTWSDPQLVQDGYCGALRSMIQLRDGRIVLGCQRAVADPGRHVCLTYVSDDEGLTWSPSNVIDLGEYGGYGDHGGGIEPTLAQLRDGRVWMLIRTYRGCFSEAFSDDGGSTWTDIKPSSIQASGAPGQLARLHSGRLVLLWNRFIDPVRRTGRREQLSLAFSEDDGRTWTEPAILAYDRLPPGGKEAEHRLAYPYVFEHVPGELWVTTMQGPLRIRVREDDFLPRRLSEASYPVRWRPEARIELDGRADEADWSGAHLERRFIFPWNDDPPPATEFRALCAKDYLYFTFRVHDEDIVVLDRLQEAEDAVFEDRVEMYFSRDAGMQDYFCLEVDSVGRAFSYRGAYYRRLDPRWTWPGLETKAVPREQGYEVEGRIPTASFAALGFPTLQPGAKLRCGLFRAEFSHDRSGRVVEQRPTIHNRGRQMDGQPPIERWMAWVDPRTEEPDFHVPTSLGWLEIVP